MPRFIYLSFLFAGLCWVGAESPSSMAASSADARPTYVTVTVPAGARVWFDDFQTTQTGRIRHFISPALEPSNNRYVYYVRAEWTDDGRMVKRTQRVSFRPGDRMLVQFSGAGQARVSRMDEATSQAYYYTPGTAIGSVAPFGPVYAPVAGTWIRRVPSSNEWGPSMPYDFKYHGQ